MSWVKLDDQFPEHPKVAQAGPLAMAMQVAALCYCNRKLTDGFVPRSIARTLLDFEVVDSAGQIFTIAITSGMSGDDVSADWVIELLLDAGIWEVVPGGFLIHDYHDYQPTKAEVEKERAAARDRMQRARDKARGEGSGDVRANGEGTSPSPVPDPVPISSSSRSDSRPDGSPAEEEFFHSVLQEIARRKLAGATNVGNQRQWLKKVIANDRADLADDFFRLFRLYPTISVSQMAGVLMGERHILRLLQRADEAS